LNLFFPFGPGELGTIQMLADNGGSPSAAETAVFYNRVFEILALTGFLIWGFVYLGWGGAIEAFFWTVILIAGVVSLTRPLGRVSDVKGRFKFIRNIWAAFRGHTLRHATIELLRSPSLFVGLMLLSGVALLLEIVAFWNIKQAFSSPLDDYILMKDLAFVPFAIIISVAALARVIPYTVAGFGIVELVMVAMFRVFDQGYLGGTTVALLCAVLLNGMTFLLFVVSVSVARSPSILDTWQLFFNQSAARST
jgi:lysylphosphatidylglycerol synthase-like protein